jgi:hypothetical protein
MLASTATISACAPATAVTGVTGGGVQGLGMA